MPAQTTQKVLQQVASCTVTIPKAYTVYHKLVPGDSITVLFDGLVLIVPQDRKDDLVLKREIIDALLR